MSRPSREEGRDKTSRSSIREKFRRSRGDFENGPEVERATSDGGPIEVSR